MFTRAHQFQGPMQDFMTSCFFYGEELLAPHPTPKQEDLAKLRHAFTVVITLTLMYRNVVNSLLYLLY